MAETPAALQLRLLQTVVEVAAEKNSTLVLPFPVELLRFLEAVHRPCCRLERIIAHPFVDTETVGGAGSGKGTRAWQRQPASREELTTLLTAQTMGFQLLGGL